MQNPPLGNLTAEEFLANYWQKQPLLIRQAVTQFDWLPTLADLTTLARQEDVESRLVEYKRGKWSCDTGPYHPARFKRLGESDWTLLVQSVNHHVPFVDALLHRFDFIPQVRLDDLMISYAPPGGSVGPHFDSYDVFLLQVGGKKRWRISSQTDLELVPDAPLKILQRFEPEQEWELEHGDMLYLPPKYAHEGVALESGMTWSIGFRAPTAQELGCAFLDFLRDRITLEGIYADPDLAATHEPCRVPADFQQRIALMLSEIRWDTSLVNEFIGRYFSEPKPHVFYEAVDDTPDVDAFAQEVARHGVRLDLKTIMLFDDAHIYINGDTLDAPTETHATLRELANTRRLAATPYSAAIIQLLLECHECGYLHIGHE